MMPDPLQLPDFLNRRKRRQQQQEPTLPRTATLKEHEGRTLPDLSAPKAETNGPDRDEFLFSIGHQAKLDKEIEEAKAKRKKFRNHLKLRGFNLAMMDMAIAEAKREDGTTLSNMRDLKRYYEFIGLPIGFQFSLFDEPQAANSNGDLMARAFTEGRERAIRDQGPDEQKWIPMSPEGQEHLRGWHEGDAIRREKVDKMDAAFAEQEKAEAEKVAKKAKAKAKADAKAAEGEPAGRERKKLN